MEMADDAVSVCPSCQAEYTASHLGTRCEDCGAVLRSGTEVRDGGDGWSATDVPSQPPAPGGSAAPPATGAGAASAATVDEEAAPPVPSPGAAVPGHAADRADAPSVDDVHATTRRRNEQDWGVRAVERIILPGTMFVTPAGIVALLVVLVAQAFMEDVYEGVRSSAALLLPLLAGTYLYFSVQNQPRGAGPDASRDSERVSIRLVEWMRELAPPVSFTVFFLVGAAAMYVLSHQTGVPARELALSGSLTVLMLSPRLLGRETAMSYYFGTILGALGWVALYGLPELS